MSAEAEDTLIDLASERLGGAAVAANDEFFAPRESLVRRGSPVFKEGVYTDRGKWMDGWETRRRRTPGHDWCVVRLGLPGSPRRLVVDTTHFKGNAPEACSVEACAVGGVEPGAWEGDAVAWTEILPRSPLSPDSVNAFRCEARGRFTHVRLNIFPDGGVARLRVEGVAVPDWARLERANGEADVAAAENGGVAVAASDEFFGSRQNLLLPGRALDMWDGWETRRRRGPGHDWVVVRLGRPGTIRRVEVDTLHFQGNAPGWCSLDVADAGKRGSFDGVAWTELLAKTELRPHALHRFESELRGAPLSARSTHARLNIYPDGGVSRLRLFAAVSTLE
jgi:allantoicase